MENVSLIETVDPEIMDAVGDRAYEISQGASLNSKTAALLALGSIPIALGAITREVYGQTPTSVLDVLRFALTLEQLEAQFYTRGVAATGLIDAADRTIFSTIRDHENTHVTALQGLITANGGTPAPSPNFDFTGKGAVAGFTFGAGQYATFQALAQAFEDTGVRAYKGQAANLMGNKQILTAALTIHSVEARHAAEVRRLRAAKGWITSNNRDGLPAFTQPIYDGEQNTNHGVDVLTLALTSQYGGANSATEAFDEPLTMAQVLAIVTPFLP